MTTLPLEDLRAAFGERLQENVSLARYTAARIGGPADALLAVHSADELAEAAGKLWELGAPFVILGGGANVLVSDAGVRQVVALNRAKAVHFDETTTPPTVWAESGASLGALARQAAQKGFSGLEWAGGIPGSVGGAVVGNAGAHGGEMASSLILADILQHDRGRQEWPVERLAFEYRSSLLKREPGQYVALAAKLRLAHGTEEEVSAKMDEFLAYRRKTQPPGASMGSMFKNPPEEYAGRLIDAVGLKGARVGSAEISALHANFFINLGQATAADVQALLNLARETVLKEFDIELELEIEMIGEW